MDIPAQLTALQAKIIGRLLEPERVPWKAYFSGWLAMPLTAEQRAAVPAQSQHLWQLGIGLPFSSFPSQSIQAPRRVVAYLQAFRQLHPHRLVSTFLVIECAADPTISCGLLYLSFELLI